MTTSSLIWSRFQLHIQNGRLCWLLHSFWSFIYSSLKHTLSICYSESKTGNVLCSLPGIWVYWERKKQSHWEAHFTSFYKWTLGSCPVGQVTFCVPLTWEFSFFLISFLSEFDIWTGLCNSGQLTNSGLQQSDWCWPSDRPHVLKQNKTKSSREDRCGMKKFTQCEMMRGSCRCHRNRGECLWGVSLWLSRGVSLGFWKSRVPLWLWIPFIVFFFMAFCLPVAVPQPDYGLLQVWRGCVLIVLDPIIWPGAIQNYISNLPEQNS